MDDRPEVTIYAARTCPYCRRAERLLTDKGVYTRIAVWRFLPGRRKALAARFGPGHTTVPQIVIHGEHVGGCDDLVALERSGQLEKLLAPWPEEP